MADNVIKKNANQAPFVDDEANAAESNIFPGNFLEYSGAADEVAKTDTEHSLDSQQIGRGLVADISTADPSQDKTTAYDNDERVSTTHVPVGGIVDARLAAGSDLSDSTEANISINDILEEANLGALKKYDGTDTTGDGTGAATETVHDQGALYMAREAKDNSGASAGVSNQVYIEVVRIA